MSGTLPELTVLSSRIAPEMTGAIRQALSIEPAERFETIREFAVSLTLGGRSTPSSMRMMPAPALSAAKSIGVLPFENNSADPENEYLADGIAEEIINSLSKVRTLRVASRTTSFAMKSRRDDIQEVGRKLKVSTVLNGSLRKSGNRIRVTAELLNVSDGSQLWADRYDREMEDVFAIQDDISESIVRALRVILGDAERKALKARTRDIRAYEYYLRGRQYVDFRKKSLEYAMEMFRRAVEVDPDYASAYAGIADCLSLMYLLFDTDERFLGEAEAAAERALELEPDLAEAHTSRGMVYSCVRDYDNGNREFETAIRLDPKLFEAPYFWGRNLIWQGKGAEAVRVLRLAQELRPESYDSVAMLSLAYKQLGKDAEADATRRLSLKLMEERLELNPDDTRAWVLSATNYAAEHDREKAEEALRRALAIDHDALTIYNVACAYALLGDKEKALDNLEAAIREGWHHKEWLSHDTDFDFLRDEPRFIEILSRM
jgi:TolB-like protein/Flp pilus assembly protein TadD